MAYNISRRRFLRYSAGIASTAVWLQAAAHPPREAGMIMTVNGPVRPADLGVTLTHEHVLVDFVGADKITRERYEEDEAYNVILPWLLAVREQGCESMMECTPAYIGRDVRLLQRLSNASGIKMITNTGLYGASAHKYLPGYVQTETAEQLAMRWIKEWREGIEDTEVRPGFIKSGVDNGPLSLLQRKLVDAAALTHLQTGLTIGIHTGNGAAALEEAGILKTRNVSLNAFIWIHAQNEKDLTIHEQLAREGAWISFDGLSKEAAPQYLSAFLHLKKQGLLSKMLLSHDAGWYNVGAPGGGKFRDYNYLFTGFLPMLTGNGFTEEEIRMLIVDNPAKAFVVK